MVDTRSSPPPPAEPRSSVSGCAQVVAAVDRCGPAPRLGAKLSEILTGLESVQKKLGQRSSTVAQAEDSQKVNEGEVQAPPPQLTWFNDE